MQSSISRILLCLTVFFAFLGTSGRTEIPPVTKPGPGQDLPPVFARALHGAPLRYVAIGGSITQAGGGWIGDWLRNQFPKSAIAVTNSGMSATGSALGIYRVERDIIAHQPDLVAIEFCVNDGDLDDEDAIRYIESIVVRLKRLPNPPAIVIVEAAAKDGVNLARHRRVAQHYGLLEVDLQQAANSHLQKEKLPWSALFTDSVHTNDAGCAFYGKVIGEALQPFVQAAENSKEPAAKVKLPPPLSAKPLLLDAEMIPLGTQSTWKQELSIPYWWNRFFLGVLTADEPGSTLVFPIRATTFGLFYAMDKSFGSYYAAVDGGQPTQIFTNTRGGYYFNILGKDLPPREHLISIALPPKDENPAEPRVNGAVKLGYALVAGRTTASREMSVQGPWSPDALSHLTFTPVPSQAWSWTGPYPAGADTTQGARSAIETAFAPETPDASSVKWQPVPQQANAWMDFRKLTGSDEPGVIYASTNLASTKDEEVLLGLAFDFYAKLWINGKLVTTNDPHRGASLPVFYKASLHPGDNRVTVKIGAGSKGFGFSLSVGRSIIKP